MIKDLIGTILGRKDPMYRFIYYHSFKRFLLTYFLFALGFAFLKLIDAYALNRLVPGLWSLDYYLLSLSIIPMTLVSLAIIISITSILVFITAKLLGKKANFAQLFFAMHSILPFFLTVKLLMTLSILSAGLPILTLTLNLLILPTILYFIFIIAKTASYFTTMSLAQSSLVIIIIATLYATALYGAYIYITDLVTASLT